MDADFATYRLVPFNLEAMKLSAYYKKAREIVVLAMDFRPERHKTFFYRKDYEDGIYPARLTMLPNVRYGGYAFSNNKYAPLDEEIELMVPDTYLYNAARPYYQGDGNKERLKIYENLMSGEHGRISLDGQTVWPRYMKQFGMLSNARNLILHDYDLNAIKDGYETVDYILSRARRDGWATRIGMKFPPQVTTGADLLKWSKFNPNSTFYSLRHNGLIDHNSFMEWVMERRKQAIYAQMEYYITPAWYSENHFLTQILPEIYKQIIFSRSFRVFFSLKYDKDFFSNPRWVTVLRLLNFYIRSGGTQPIPWYITHIDSDTMYDFARTIRKYPRKLYGPDAIDVEEARDAFQFVREVHPWLFDAFYNLNLNELGGTL